MQRGLLIPFRRDSRGDFANGTGEALAIAKVTQLVGTQPEEIDTRPTFGCPLRDLRHQNNTPMLEAMAESRVQDAFAAWLPSYEVQEVRATRRGRELGIEVAFNERLADGSARFPNNLTAAVAVTIGG